MKLSELIPDGEQLKLLQGVEATLQRRRRAGILGGLAAIVGVIIQIVPSLSKGKLFDSIGRAITERSFDWAGLTYELVGLLVFVVGFGAYLLLVWTRFLLKESEEPFRYTIWIDPFQAVKDSPGDRFVLRAADRIALLDHDLRERLDRRIRRFSLLDDSAADLKSAALPSHIRVSGHWAVREDKEKDQWILHVMPRVRIGGPGNPATIAFPVRYPLTEPGVPSGVQVSPDGERVPSEELGVDRYNQIVERVYSSVATEIYRKIESDVKEKIKQFPTAYMRAVALFHEGEDFARSNTIDAYDRALELYREAQRYFDLARPKYFSNLMLKLPVCWRWAMKFIHMRARVNIGYAKCLIYRRRISTLTGRPKNPLFEIRNRLEQVHADLYPLHERLGRIKGDNNRLNAFLTFLTFPKDSWARAMLLQPPEVRFGIQKRIRFEACVVTALTYWELGAVRRAADWLERAKAVDPPSAEANALYFCGGDRV